ncbi:MAG: hypothetical protein KDH09_06855 [Chrysiogenetes bacterium]|nr:hypothetical protein [Chrysiogenetes bacterium]
MSSRQMRILMAQSAGLSEKQHKSAFSQAITALRRTGNPRQVTALLSTLERDARPLERAAYEDLRRWIDARLREENELSVEGLLLELGWLRRMCVARCGGEQGQKQGGGRRRR